MEGNQINSYKDLVVWQKAMDLVVLVYELTELFPGKETYNLISQMRRAAVSIPSNIAEGRSRNTRKDFCRFLTDAFASASELETQIEISKRLNLCNSKDCEKLDMLLLEVIKILKVIIGKLRS